jgi:predicted nuclease with TOPRIM domain
MTKIEKMKLLSKALKIRLKKLENCLKEKDSLLRSAEGSLAEVHSQNEKLSKELEEARTLLEKNSDSFNRESKPLNARIEAEIEKNIKLSEIAKILWDKCFGFATQCIVWLMAIFNSIGAKSEEVTLYAEDIPGALECVEKEVDVLDEVITGHSDFCALVASHGTAAAFMKARCNHVRVGAVMDRDPNSSSQNVKALNKL